MVLEVQESLEMEMVVEHVFYGVRGGVAGYLQQHTHVPMLQYAQQGAYLMGCVH